MAHFVRVRTVDDLEIYINLDHVVSLEESGDTFTIHFIHGEMTKVRRGKGLSEELQAAIKGRAPRRRRSQAR
jgi:hypothetical protein